MSRCGCALSPCWAEAVLCMYAGARKAKSAPQIAILNAPVADRKEKKSHKEYSGASRPEQDEGGFWGRLVALPDSLHRKQITLGSNVPFTFPCLFFGLP